MYHVTKRRDGKEAVLFFLYEEEHRGEPLQPAKDTTQYRVMFRTDHNNWQLSASSEESPEGYNLWQHVAFYKTLQEAADEADNRAKVEADGMNKRQQEINELLGSQ